MVYKLDCLERNLPASFFSESGINSSSCDSLRTSSDNLKSAKRNRTRNRTASKEKLNKSNSLSRYRTNPSFLNTIHVSTLSGYIDVGDGCWRTNVLMTKLRCR